MIEPPAAPRLLDAAEVLLGAVLLAVSIVSLAGILLLEAGLFGAGSMGAAAGLAVAGIIGIGRRYTRRQPVARLPARDWAALGGVVVFAGAVFIPPAEAWVEGSDASAYLGIGRLFAEEGRISPIDPFLASLPRDVLPELFVVPPTRPDMAYFPGAIGATPEGRLVPEFFHLTPVWIGALGGWLGSRAGPYVNVLFGVLSIAMVWAAGRRLSTSIGALAAAGLLAINFGEIWFARLPSSEMAAQYFVVSSLWALLVAADTNRAAAGALAGVSAGLATVGRLDAFVLVAAPVLGSVVLQLAAARRLDRARLWCLVAGAATIAFSVWHAFVFAGPYSQRIIQLFTASKRWSIGSARNAVILGALAAIVWMAHSALHRVRWVQRALAIAAAAGAIAWVAIMAPRIRMSQFLLIVTPAGLLAAMAGLGVLFLSRHSARALPIGTVFLTSAMVLLPNVRDDTAMPMPLRRYVVSLLPLAAILIGCAIGALGRGPSRVRAWMAAAALVAFGVAWGRTSTFVLVDPPLVGVHAALTPLADLLPRSGLTWYDEGTPSHLPLSMHYEFGRSSLVVTGGRQGRAVDRVTGLALAAGRQVRFVMRSDTDGPRSLTRADFGDWVVRPVASLSIDFPAIDGALPSLPGRVVMVTHGIDVYEVAPPPRGGVPIPWRLDLGAGDFGWALAGVHGRERMDGQTARWTDGEARLIVPPLNITDSASDRVTLVCRIASWRPLTVAPPAVTVQIDDEPVGALAIAFGGFAEYTLRIPAAAADRLRAGAVMTIRSPAFVPADVGLSADERRLGVALDWLEFRERGSH